MRDSMSRICAFPLANVKVSKRIGIPRRTNWVYLTDRLQKAHRLPTIPVERLPSRTFPCQNWIWKLNHGCSWKHMYQWNWPSMGWWFAQAMGNPQMPPYQYAPVPRIARLISISCSHGMHLRQPLGRWTGWRWLQAMCNWQMPVVGYPPAPHIVRLISISCSHRMLLRQSLGRWTGWRCSQAMCTGVCLS